MAYYCTRCHRWHYSGDVAKKHRTFASINKRLQAKGRKIREKRAKLFRAPKIKQYKKKKPIKPIKPIMRKSKKPVLIIKTKKKQKPIKPIQLRKPTGKISKRRRGQLAMKPVDVHERAMAKRIQRQSGMTHIQVMHLIKGARETDFDIEHGIDWRLSKDRSEQYEFAQKQMYQAIEPTKHRTMRELAAEEMSWGLW